MKNFLSLVKSGGHKVFRLPLGGEGEHTVEASV